jgi:hypothetical protein
VNNSLLNDNFVREEIKKLKTILEFNGNEGKTDTNLWDTMKAMLRGKLIALRPPKETEQSIHYQLDSTSENSSTKRSKYTQEE